jgi:hypothetical protein
MATSTSQSVHIDTPSLGQEAEVWDKQSAKLAVIADEVKGLTMTHLQAGVFFGIVTAYRNLVNELGSRCTEGAGVMGKIAEALHGLAVTLEPDKPNH